MGAAAWGCDGSLLPQALPGPPGPRGAPGSQVGLAVLPASWLAPLPLPRSPVDVQYIPCVTYSSSNVDPRPRCRSRQDPGPARCWLGFVLVLYGGGPGTRGLSEARGPLCLLAVTTLLSILLVSGQSRRPGSSRASRAACKWESCSLQRCSVGWSWVMSNGMKDRCLHCRQLCLWAGCGAENDPDRAWVAGWGEVGYGDSSVLLDLQ